MVLPCRPDGCSCLPISVSEGNSISCRTLMSVRTRCCDIRTEAWDSTSLSWNLHKIFFELFEAHF
jgi:hypothetical protein